MIVITLSCLPLQFNVPSTDGDPCRLCPVALSISISISSAFDTLCDIWLGAQTITCKLTVGEALNTLIITLLVCLIVLRNDQCPAKVMLNDSCLDWGNPQFCIISLMERFLEIAGSSYQTCPSCFTTSSPQVFSDDFMTDDLMQYFGLNNNIHHHLSLLVQSRHQDLRGASAIPPQTAQLTQLTQQRELGRDPLCLLATSYRSINNRQNGIGHEFYRPGTESPRRRS